MQLIFRTFRAVCKRQPPRPPLPHCEADIAARIKNGANAIAINIQALRLDWRSLSSRSCSAHGSSCASGALPRQPLYNLLVRQCWRRRNRPGHTRQPYETRQETSKD